MLKHSLLISLFMILLSHSLQAQVRDDVKRTFTLRSGYMKEFNSNYAIGSFIMETYMAGEWLFDKSSQLIIDENLPKFTSTLKPEYSTRIGRLAYGLLWLKWSFEYGILASFAYHEYGHANRAAARGYDYYFTIGTKRHLFYEQARENIRNGLVQRRMNWLDANDFSSKQLRGKPYHNFFSFYSSLVSQKKYHGEIFRKGKLFERSQPENSYMISVQSGVNYQMQMSEMIEERAYLHGASFLYLPVYVFSKISSSMYFSGSESTATIQNPNTQHSDMTQILGFYNQKRDYSKPTLEDIYDLPYSYFTPSFYEDEYNYSRLNELKTRKPITHDKYVANILSDRYYNHKEYGITRNNIEVGNVASLIFSSTTYALLYSSISYVMSGKPLIQTWSPYGFRLPDLSFYHTRRGISYKLTTGYRYKEWSFPVAVEHVFKGDITTEVSTGVDYNSGKYLLGGIVIIGRAIGLGGKIEKKITAFSLESRVGMRARYHSINTLDGERNMPVLGKGRFHSLETDFFVSLVY